jgi:lysophospholipase L1-like esterase
VLVTPLTRRQFQDGRLIDDLAPWAQATRRVAAELGVPLVDLHARSRAAVQALGPAAATQFAQLPPTAELWSAAAQGTTIEASGAAPAPLGAPSSAQTNASIAPMAQPRISFDYTHLGPEGAEFFAKLVVEELAGAVPDLRRNLIP